LGLFLLGNLRVFPLVDLCGDVQTGSFVRQGRNFFWGPSAGPKIAILSWNLSAGSVFQGENICCTSTGLHCHSYGERAVGLSWQQGPLSTGSIGRFLVPEPLPKKLLYVEPLRRRMRELSVDEVVRPANGGGPGPVASG
jgi:hypothetical protein